jgi:ATP-dependent Clp protease ATP-binding subunit ClpX
MTDAMFEMPSQKEKELKITLDYATQKLDKSILSKLKVA